MQTPEISQAVLHQLFRDYCLTKFNYNADTYASATGRDEHIDVDARSYYDSDSGVPIRDLVGAAYRAGYDAGQADGYGQGRDEDELWEMANIHRAEGES